MTPTQQLTQYNRKITPWERILNIPPFAIVTMVTRIKGDVSKELLQQAVLKVQQRHTLLRVRTIWDEDQNPCFTTENAEPIPVKAYKRSSDTQWKDIFNDECKIPFDLSVRPPIRFILLQSPTISEVIIFCHHVICDGLSLAHLARDLMTHLGDPSKEPEILPNPIPITGESVPDELALGGFMQKILTKYNNKWELEKIVFDEQDYLDLHKVYWENFTHEMISIEFTEEQTKTLVEKCRQEKVTVNSALTAAFIGSQLAIQGKKPFHSKIGVAGDLRGRMKNPAGEVMGFYAGVVEPKFKYKSKKNFWDNARAFHAKIKPMYTDKNLFKNAVQFDAMDPSIMESRHFKVLGNLVCKDAVRYQKLSEFGSRDDVVLSLLKRSKVDTIDHIFMGTAMTNLTRMDFPRMYGEFELDRLIMHPGGAHILSTVNLVLGVVTCSGKMSIIMEFAKRTIDMETAERIREKALDFLEI